MEKKRYITPQMEVVKIHQFQLLSGSPALYGSSDPEHPYEFD